MGFKSPEGLPCTLLTCHQYIIRSVARFRLRAHILRIETVTWTHNTSLTCGNTSPTCDLWDANDVQDEQHVLFHCTHPHMVSLQRTYASLFPPAGFNNVSACLGQENDKLNFFLQALIAYDEQASSHTS